MGRDDASAGSWQHFSGTIATVVTLARARGGPVGTEPANEAPPRNAEAPWSPYLLTLDEALDQRDVITAVRAWHAAHVAAFRGGRCDGLFEVGDAYLRIGAVAGIPCAAAAKARELYLAALFRARQHGDLDGTLRAVQAFVGVGDRAAAEECLRMAQDLAAAAPDHDAEARVQAIATLLVTQ